MAALNLPVFGEFPDVLPVNDHRGPSLRAVERVCDILDALTEHPNGVGLSVLAGQVRLPKSSTFRYLAALETRGYVERARDGVRYRLVPDDATRSIAPLRLDALLAAARPLMERLLAESTAAAVALGGLDECTIVYHLVCARSNADPRIPRAADRELLHTTALGKAVAAQLSDGKVLDLLAKTGMPSATERTLTTPSAFLRELNRVRGEGFAVSRHERYADVTGVAVAIGGEALGLTVGAISDELPPDRILATVRRLRRASVALAREIRP